MSVRRSVGLAAAIGVALLLVFGAFLFRQTTDVTDSVTDVLTIYDPAASQVALLETAISDMQRGVSNFLLTQEESDLTPYVDGARRSDLALQQLRGLLASDQQLSLLVEGVATDRQAWIDQVARPTIDAVRAGELDAALATFKATVSDELFLSLQSDAATLRALIEDRRAGAFDILTDVSFELIRTVVLSVALLWTFLVLAYVLTHRRVLRPLDSLSRQVRSVARRGEHTQTIGPTGPAELRALGADVEEMRRRLVAEIDEARSAREALDQGAPVVAAIRAELMASSAVRVPGLTIFGAVQPAEGVLAGDWWDSAVLGTGEAAVLVADISGHGAAAGVAAMQLKHAIQHDLLAGKDISDIAVSAADVFNSHPDRFATVAAVCVHPDTGHVRYINAGHHEPLVIDPQGAVVEALGRTGPIMSWLGGEWAIGTTMLEPGHTLVLYSDGLIESHDLDGNELGEEQLYAWLAQMPADQRGPRALVPWLLGAARQRAIDWNRDDVTIVAVQRSAPAPDEPSETRVASALRRRRAERS